MSLRTSANRYAKALFDVALEEKADLAKIDRDLAALADTLVAGPELSGAAEGANVPDAVRLKLMAAIADRLAVAEPVKKLVALLTRDRKLALVPELARAYRERLLAHQNVVRADVTTAAPLSPEKTRALEDSLAAVTGKKVELSLSVDPELLGGVVARIGSTVFDGSVRAQLRKMREQLAESSL